ncbi:MAG: hypothetical protein PVJ72_13875 [Gammaproteobacteria bacterium]|jgi:hypothetical protein
MTESLKKKIVAILVGVLIILPVHIAMGSVSVIDRDNQSMQTMEFTTPHQLSGGYHNADDQNNPNDHCKQDTGCNGCDSCSHCLNVICSLALFNTQASHSLFTSPPILLYKADNSAAFRPPRHS